MSLTKLHIDKKIVVGNMIVFTNSSDEVFVQNSNVTLRISNYNDSIVVTSHGNLIQPIAVNGLPGFRVSNT